MDEKCSEGIRVHQEIKGERFFRGTCFPVHPPTTHTHTMFLLFVPYLDTVHLHTNDTKELEIII